MIIKKVLSFLLIVLISFGLVGCFGSDSNSTSQKAIIEITSLNTGLESYGDPYYEGTVTNKGDETAYNVSITFKIYNSANKSTIIDTAVAYPADLQDIDPGESATFKAIAFDLSSTSQLQYYDTSITFLEK